LQVAIFPDASALERIAAPQPAGATPINITLYGALVDTGATSTCISQKVVREMGLTPVGKCQMISASQVVEVNQYPFVVALPMGLQQLPNGMMNGNFSAFESVTGLEFKSAGTSYEVLVGMDILRGGSLKLDFDGHFSFCF